MENHKRSAADNRNSLDPCNLQTFQCGHGIEGPVRAHRSLNGSQASAENTNAAGQPPQSAGDTISTVETEQGPPTAEQGQDVECLQKEPPGPLFSVFTLPQKRYIVFMTAFGGFFSPLSANIYLPALNALSKDLHVSNSIINLTLTSYMIFQGLAPTVFGDLGDMIGRRPVYILSFVIYLGANIGLALQTNYAALFVLRCLQSTGSSGTVALGNGVIADIATSGERGKYIGYAVSGPMVAPAIAPVIGGVLTEFLGWRAIFWFLAIMGVVYLIPFAVTFPETCRNVVGNGSVPAQRWNVSLLNYLQVRGHTKQTEVSTQKQPIQERTTAQTELASRRKLRWPNPLRTIHIILEKDVGIILFYNSLIYTAFYDVTATIPSLFAEIYNFNDLQIGLCYIPFGVGCACASIITGHFMDWNYRRVALNSGFHIDIRRGDDLQHFPLEKARVQVIYPMIYCGIAAILCYGWVLEKNAPLAAPLILHFIIGLTLTGGFNVMSTMLVDLYPLSPSTATAANNLVRCWMGAAGTAIIAEMIKGMGRGWCFTFIAAVVFLACGLLWVEERWGPGWREERRVRFEKEKEKEKAKRNQVADVETPRDALEKS